MRMQQVNKDLATKLQQIANEKQATIISFVAPDDAVRVSPVTFASAAIEEKEMYKLESLVKEAQNHPGALNSLHLIIHTPGGELHTSYKIAQFLRSKFNDISAYVPYQAASGGTLLCCSANKLYIGELGNITPIDPQIRYKTTWVSAYSILRAVDTMREQFGEYSPAEVPSPWQQMAEKLDPIIYDEMSTLVFNTISYAHRLLTKAGYDNDKAIRIALNLTKTVYNHSNCIMVEQAKDLGLAVDQDDETMKVYSELVSDRLKQKSAAHVVDVYYPQNVLPSAATPIEQPVINVVETVTVAVPGQA